MVGKEGLPGGVDVIEAPKGWLISARCFSAGQPGYDVKRLYGI